MGRSVEKIYRSHNGVTQLIDDRTAALEPFGSCSDKRLADIIAAYYAGTYSLGEIQSVWSIGDTREISLAAIGTSGTGWSGLESHAAQTVEIQILDFDHDTLTTAAGGITKALITVDLVDCLNEIGPYATSANSEARWKVNGQIRRNWCNDGFYNALPTYVKNLVRQASKENKGGSTSTITYTNDYCFLLSQYEVTKTMNASSVTNNAEGTQYKLYETTAARIKKQRSSNIAYHIRTSMSGYNGYINTSGACELVTTYTQNRGLAPGFCM